MANIFFTSDTHFNHERILTMGNGRPFYSIETHNESLINNWNAVVKDDDQVYVLGDFAWANEPRQITSILSRLNGKKYLIIGNHDRQKLHAYALNEGYWQYMRMIDTLTYVTNEGVEYKIVLSHCPFLEFTGSYKPNTIHCYGHIHDTKNYDDIYKKLGFKALNIGVDVSSSFPDTKPYSPISIESVLKQIKLIYGE